MFRDELVNISWNLSTNVSWNFVKLDLKTLRRVRKRAVSLLLFYFALQHTGPGCCWVPAYCLFCKLQYVITRVDVQLYEQWFEEKFLQEMGDFYRQEARKLLDEYNCSEYMDRVCLYVV